MADAFQLTVPATAPYRTLSAEVAARFAELAGGTEADGAALSAALAEAVDVLAADAAPEAAVTLAFSSRPDGIDVTMRCGARTATVRQAMVLPA